MCLTLAFVLLLYLYVFGQIAEWWIAQIMETWNHLGYRHMPINLRISTTLNCTKTLFFLNKVI